jgi:hypothetical protein
VDIPASPPKVPKPKPKVEKQKVAKPKVVTVESSDTELVSAVEYISNFTDQLRGMLSKEKEKNFLVQTMFQFMGLKIDVLQKVSYSIELRTDDSSPKPVPPVALQSPRRMRSQQYNTFRTSASRRGRCCPRARNRIFW